MVDSYDTRVLKIKVLNNLNTGINVLETDIVGSNSAINLDHNVALWKCFVIYKINMNTYTLHFDFAKTLVCYTAKWSWKLSTTSKIHKSQQLHVWHTSSQLQSSMRQRDLQQCTHPLHYCCGKTFKYMSNRAARTNCMNWHQTILTIYFISTATHHSRSACDGTCGHCKRYGVQPPRLQ